MLLSSFFSAEDIQALSLSLRLATTVTFILLIMGTPLAYWLANTHSKWKSVVNALVALPLVLPPTVLGFYILLLLGPQGALGQVTHALGLGSLVFSFWGLVIASVIYSLPFVVQPIQNAIAAVGTRPLEVAASLRASPWDSFFSVVLPLAKPGFITAAILGFTHTLGEFGLVLMIGGNIPAETRVASIQLFNHVDALEYPQAHGLALILMSFSFVLLLLLYRFQPTQKTGLTYGN